MFAVTRRNFAHGTGFCLAGVSRAGLQCYCRAGWRAGRYAFMGRIWPAGRRLPDFGIEFDLKFNSAKSNVMVFCCNLLKDIPVPNFMLNGVTIDKVSNCKYLGHCINDKLIDDDDMARQRKQIYAQGNALVRKFYMCTETVRISLFKSYCSSLYTSSLWCNFRSESLRKLCVAYNNVF